MRNVHAQRLLKPPVKHKLEPLSFSPCSRPHWRWRISAQVSVIMVPGSPLPDRSGNGDAQLPSRCSILWTILSQETSTPMPKNADGLKQVTALSVLTPVLVSTSKCIQGQTWYMSWPVQQQSWDKHPEMPFSALLLLFSKGTRTESRPLYKGESSAWTDCKLNESLEALGSFHVQLTLLIDLQMMGQRRKSKEKSCT